MKNKSRSVLDFTVFFSFLVWGILAFYTPKYLEIPTLIKIFYPIAAILWVYAIIVGIRALWYKLRTKEQA